MDRIIGAAVALIVLGIAVALVTNSASALYDSQNTSSQVADLNQIATAEQQLHQASHYQYGSSTITPSALVTKLDPDIVTGAGATAAIITRWGTTMVLTGNNGNFTIKMPQVPTANCTDLETSSGLAAQYSSLLVTGGTARTLPNTNPDQAAVDCANGPVDVTLTAKGSPG